MTLSKAISTYFDQLVYAIGNYHYNWHPAIELLMVIRGQVIANVDGYQYALGPNDLLLINANQGHATLASTPNTLAIRTHIAPRFFQEQGASLANGQFSLNSALLHDHPLYPDLRRAIASYYLSGSEFSKNSAAFRLASLLYDHFFIASGRDQIPADQQNDQLTQVASDIQKGYQSSLSLGDLAQKYGYSKPYFSKIFKQHFGIGFYEYLTRERLQHALSDLNNSELKVGDIALNNGFNEIKSFNQAFKKHFGITPSDYQGKFSPQLRKVDQTFQQQLPPAQQQAVRERLGHLLTQASTNIPPAQECVGCSYKEDSLRYHLLKKELKELLNDKN